MPPPAADHGRAGAMGGRRRCSIQEEVVVPNALRRCPICKSETGRATLAELSGEEAPLAVAVKGLPVTECPQGHRFFAVPDFPLLLLDRLVENDEPTLPVSEAMGLLIKHDHCAGCGAELGKGAGDPHTFSFGITLNDLPAFEVALTLPVHRCASCGREQLHSVKEVRSRTPAALAHAFKAAKIAAT
jgi:hypothetical protein